MWLKTLQLFNFKNYNEAKLQFSPAVNVFTGENGAGKTNLLDAIHYLSLCKIYFNPIDSQQIKQGTDWIMVQGSFEKEEIESQISCSVKRNQKKVFQKNKKEYPRLADHIGQFPLVMISPSDTGLIMEGSEERRKFMDNVISQTDSQYLDHLIAYNRCLLQRNSVLKQAGKTGRLDPSLLEVLDAQLISYGEHLFQKRKGFMEEFLPEFERHYHFISSDAEAVQLRYESQLQEARFIDLLANSADRDRLLERTNCGIHKDELVFSIHGGMPLKKFGSQGQQKSFLIALKLAQYTYLHRLKGFKPLLLLDDVFDKLDDFRVRKLMEMVSHDEFGQLFITDTEADRIIRIFEGIEAEVRYFTIHKGTVA
ncbi:MAG TPA: DNA replication/repair protein RecF [Sphingobacteriaceae bacterium]|nr:DNA replication/repair protein RecF [Sphingobacteriaceae bacterium]